MFIFSLVTTADGSTNIFSNSRISFVGSLFSRIISFGFELLFAKEISLHLKTSRESGRLSTMYVAGASGLTSGFISSCQTTAGSVLID
jgi:hypothetical protein